MPKTEEPEAAMLEAALHAMIELGSSAQPGPDGLPPVPVRKQMAAVLASVTTNASGDLDRDIKAALAQDLPDRDEAGRFISESGTIKRKVTKTLHGTEPPGEGWTYLGNMTWTREEEVEEAVLAAEDAPHRIAVVGGGPGGLFAAYVLSQKLPDALVTLFESSDRLGGKISTAAFSDGTRFEAGVAELYEYKGGGDDPLRQLIEDDLGLDTVDMTGGGVVIDGEVYRNLREVEEKRGEASHQAILDFYKRCEELMPREAYSSRWSDQKDHPWASKTFAEVLEKEIPDAFARKYVTAACRSDLATEPHNCSALNGLKNVLMDNLDYMNLFHIRGGITLLADALVEKIEDAHARLCTGTRVVSVLGGGKKYAVRYRDDLGDHEEDFDAVVLCLPGHWLGQVAYLDKTMSLADVIHSHCVRYDHPAHYLRVSMRFSGPWWMDFNLPGDYWTMDLLGGCCVYDEASRWEKEPGYVLSFLLAGSGAQLLVSHNQSEREIVQAVLDRLPPDMAEPARSSLVEARVDRYVGSLCAQPGGWTPEDLISAHQPSPKTHPGVFVVGDYLFDCTLNGALVSANTAVDLLLEYLGEKAQKATPAVENLAPDGTTLSN